MIPTLKWILHPQQLLQDHGPDKESDKSPCLICNSFRLILISFMVGLFGNFPRLSVITLFPKRHQGLHSSSPPTALPRDINMAQKTTSLIINAIDDFIDELGFRPYDVSPNPAVPLPLNISKRRDTSRFSDGSPDGMPFMRSDSISSTRSDQSISSNSSSSQ